MNRLLEMRYRLRGAAFWIGLGIWGLHAGLATAGEWTMSQYWPHSDGLSWTYRQTYSAAPWYNGGLQVRNKAVFSFEGDVQVPGNIVAQDLRVQVEGLDELSRTARLPRAADPLLRELWLLRPELREVIEQRSVGSASRITTGAEEFHQLFLFPRAFHVGWDEIVAYDRSVLNQKSWIWLVSDLEPGTAFELRILPDLADIILRGTVVGTEEITIESGFYSDVLRVAYEIDYGRASCVDSEGKVIGSHGSRRSGFVLYAAGVGPIVSEESLIPYENLVGSCPHAVHVGDYGSLGRLELMIPPLVPVQSVTWGWIKARFGTE